MWNNGKGKTAEPKSLYILYNSCRCQPHPLHGGGPQLGAAQWPVAPHITQPPRILLLFAVGWQQY
jgi:hypothetical protein